MEVICVTFHCVSCGWRWRRRCLQRRLRKTTGGVVTGAAVSSNVALVTMLVVSSHRFVEPHIHNDIDLVGH